MDYLVDGYNLMFRIEGQQKKTFQESREVLIDLLNEELKVIKTSVLVIFDSSEKIQDFAQKAILSNIEVVYAPKGLTADQYIIELVDQAKSPKTLTVVTSDAGLARQCQHLGANTQSIDDFLAIVEKRNKVKGGTKPPFKEHPQQVERLRKIFEDRLKDNT